MSGNRIMIVEHDPALQTILIDLFTRAQYLVSAAVSTDDVRLMLTWFEPEVAVISGDSRGTFASGWQTAALIADVDPTLPLIMLTTNQLVLAEQGQTQRGRLFAAGLLKPFQLTELLDTVAACLAMSSTHTRQILLQMSDDKPRRLMRPNS